MSAEAPVPLAEQPTLADAISAVRLVIQYANLNRTGWAIQGSIPDQASLDLALATLQQHERLIAGLVAANERIARLEAGLRDCQGALKEARYWVVKSGVSHPSSLAAIVDPAIEAAEETLTP